MCTGVSWGQVAVSQLCADAVCPQGNACVRSSECAWLMWKVSQNKAVFKIRFFPTWSLINELYFALSFLLQILLDILLFPPNFCLFLAVWMELFKVNFDIHVLSWNRLLGKITGYVVFLFLEWLSLPHMAEAPAYPLGQANDSVAIRVEEGLVLFSTH